MRFAPKSTKQASASAASMKHIAPKKQKAEPERLTEAQRAALSRAHQWMERFEVWLRGQVSQLNADTTMRRVEELASGRGVHLHGYGATTFGRLCAWRMGIPAILHEHANHTDTPWFQKIADKILAPHTDLAIAVSASTGEFTTRARLMPAERTKVVYLGAPLDEFARSRSAAEVAAARQTLGIEPGTIALGTITRLMPSKGNQYLIAAAPKVLARHPNARVFIVGEGELQPELEAQAKALGLGDRLVFAGFTRDVAAALSALDVVVFPSLWEGTPLTMFEALAMGKPIVATDADGLLDVLTDGRDALVVPKANADRLVEAICRVVEHPELAMALAAGARKTGARYDIAAFVRKMERLYLILHDTSRATGRAGILQADLSFLKTDR